MRYNEYTAAHWVFSRNPWERSLYGRAGAFWYRPWCSHRRYDMPRQHTMRQSESGRHLQVLKVRYGTPDSTRRHPGQHTRDGTCAPSVHASGGRMRRAARNRACLRAHDRSAAGGIAVRPQASAHQPRNGRVRLQHARVRLRRGALRSERPAASRWLWAAAGGR